MTSTQLGRVQLLIMQVLWKNGRATAREITESLNSVNPIAHSTVQTLLRGLVEKGAAKYEAEGRTFVFVPMVEEDHFRQKATRDLLNRVFEGNVASLVSHLLKHEKLSRPQLDELRKLIADRDKKARE